MKKVFVWSNDLSLIKGYRRSLLIDCLRGNFELVPNDYAELKKMVEGKSLDELKTSLSEYELEWFFEGIEKEYFLEVPEIFSNSFPPLSSHWESSALISNAIFHFGSDINEIISFLKELYCRHVLIIIECEKELIDLMDKHVHDSDFRCIDIVVNSDGKDAFDRQSYIDKFPIIRSISHQEFNKKLHNPLDIFTPIFGNNFDIYRESLTRNVYFNQKLYIDANGRVHSAFEDDREFGLYNKLNPKEIINTPGFDVYWYANKENTDICKDCELRRICIDNRLPVKRSNKEEWYHENECAYNPYIAKWKGEKGYLSLSEINVISNKIGFASDEKKLSLIRLDQD